MASNMDFASGFDEMMSGMDDIDSATAYGMPNHATEVDPAGQTDDDTPGWNDPMDYGDAGFSSSGDLHVRG